MGLLFEGQAKQCCGFGAFSYGHSQLDGVMEYIREQERHHAAEVSETNIFDFLRSTKLPTMRNTFSSASIEMQNRSPLTGFGRFEGSRRCYKQVTPSGVRSLRSNLCPEITPVPTATAGPQNTRVGGSLLVGSTAEMGTRGPLVHLLSRAMFDTAPVTQPTLGR